MSEAPERIWAWWDDEYDTGLINTHGDKRYTPEDAREYVRADRIAELEAKLAKAMRSLIFIGCEDNAEGHYARISLAELKGKTNER